MGFNATQFFEFGKSKVFLPTCFNITLNQTAPTLNANSGGTPRCLYFSESQNKIYSLSNNPRNILQIEVLNSFDIRLSNITKVKAFTLDTLPNEMEFKPDGTKLYILGGTNSAIYQFSLSTAWDISTMVYDNVSLNLSTENTNVVGLYIKPDGTKLYTLGNNGVVYQYNLSTPYDISTATYSNGVATYYTIENADIQFNPNGTQLFVLHWGYTRIYQYNLSVAWDLTTISGIVGTSPLLNWETTPFSFQFSSNGLFLLVQGYQSGYIKKYSMTTPYDITTLIDTTDAIYTINKTGNRSVFVTPDKSTIIMSTSAEIVSYPLVINGDLSTIKRFNKRNNPIQDSNQLTDLIFNLDGTILYTLDYTAKRIYQYSLSIPYDINTLTYTNKNFSVSGQCDIAQGIRFKPDGLKVFVIDYTTAKIYQYNLSVAWDISTAVYSGLFLSVINNTRGFDFSLDGKQIFVSNLTTTIYQYSLKNGWDFSINATSCTKVLTGSIFSLFTINNELYTIASEIIRKYNI